MLKIGDTFTQFGKTYKVVDENDAGLISKVVEEEAPKEEVPTPKRRTRKAVESV